MSKPEDFGTEANGGVNEVYCAYCYQNGKFEGEIETVEQMIEACAPFLVEAGEAKSLEEANTMLQEFLPGLKRWAKA